MLMTSELALFSETDHVIVRQAMALLPKRQLKAVTLRFWQRLSVNEISIAMNTDFQTVETLLSRAFQFLKDICLSRPEFSRSRAKVLYLEAKPLPAAVSIKTQTQETSSYAV